MIRVNKDYNDIPEILKSEKVIAEQNEIIKNKIYDLRNSTYNYSEIGKKLELIYFNKCAYCESKLPSSSGVINQYRPKSRVDGNSKHLGYYWLVYEWSNLLFVCPVCNRNKGTHFPIENENDRVYEPKNTVEITQFLANKSPLIDEKPLLLNPEIDEPKEHLNYANDGRIHGKTVRGNLTIEILCLNREQLLFSRLQKVNEIKSILRQSLFLFTENKTSKIAFIKYFDLVFDRIKQQSQPESEYSLLGYYMLQNFEEFFINDFENENVKDLLRKAFHYYITKIELISEPSKDVYINESNILPYSLKQIQIENFRGIIKTGISNLPIDSQWIFLAGNNGAGKTSVIQAIALGLWGQADTLDKQYENSNIAIEINNNRQNIINNLKNSSNFTPFKYFVAYGPSRLSMQSDSSENAEIKESSRTYNVFNDNGMLLNIESELSRWSQIEKFKARYESIKSLLIEILNISDIKVEEKNYKKLLYKEKEENGDSSYNWLELKNIASGYRSIIGMVGDMLLRFYKIEEYENINPKDIAGIVLIDELDLHLHPKWQKRLVEVLTTTFKKIQFIVSTHSFIPLLGAPQNSVFLKVGRNVEKGVFIERINLNIKVLLPETLLTSELFDFKSITHKDLKDFSELRTELTYNEMQFNDEVKRKLKEYADKDDYPTDLFD